MIQACTKQTVCIHIRFTCPLSHLLTQHRTTQMSAPPAANTKYDCTFSNVLVLYTLTQIHTRTAPHNPNGTTCSQQQSCTDKPRCGEWWCKVDAGSFHQPSLLYFSLCLSVSVSLPLSFSLSIYVSLSLSLSLSQRESDPRLRDSGSDLFSDHGLKSAQTHTHSMT